MSVDNERYALQVSTGGLAADLPLAMINGLKDSQRKEFDWHTIVSVQNDPVADSFYYNSGDTTNGLSAAILVGMLLDTKFPRLPEKVKAVISFAAGTLVVSGAELTSFLNHGDVNDIPAGVVGSLMYLGIRHFARERFISRQMSPQVVGVR